MNKIFLTPGPSQLYPTLEKHLQEALKNNIGSISHRGKKFEEVFSETVSNLRKFLAIPETHKIFFLSSGTEAMERVIENLVEKESFHFINGSFSRRFYSTAEELRKKPKKIETDLGKGFDIFSIQIPKSSELVCFTHNETSTGVMIPIEDIIKVKEAYPEKLIAVDIVSSIPYPRINFAKLDTIFFSVQKLFGLPAGLAVVIVSPKALEKSLFLQKKGINIGSYHCFPSLLKFAEKYQTPETPPVLHMYLLSKVIEDMIEIGINTLRKEIDLKAKALYDFFDNHPCWHPFVNVKKFRSPTVIAINTSEQTEDLKKYLESKGIVVGSGYGSLKVSQIRIANFPATTYEHIDRLLQYCFEFK